MYILSHQKREFDKSTVDKSHKFIKNHCYSRRSHVKKY